MPSPTPTLAELVQDSRLPLPKIPRLSRDSTWETTFTHESLPDSNLVLAALGRDIFRACVTEWLMDADPLVTMSELELKYVRRYPYADRLSVEDRVRVFEAYVGAVHRDQGFEVVKQWTYELMEWDNMTMLDSLHE